MRITAAIFAILLCAGIAAALWLPGREGVLGSFSTSLQGRTRGQHINAIKSARALDGVVIESGQTFSFNKTVGSWSPDRGYVLAPVSYDGQMVVDWGGGVCQTSSTLYNALLIAGLEIVQRNRHNWAPKYVPAGRDAAVAQRNIDLQARNPYPWPVRIRVQADDNRIGFQIIGRAHGPMARIASIPQGQVPPSEIVRIDSRLAPGGRRIITRGRPGVSVAVYRTYLHGPKSNQRELVSRDSYPAMNRIIAVKE